MGLAERRAAKEFETYRFPGLKAEIDRSAGFEVLMEIDWESLAVDDYAHMYDDCWGKVYFKPLADAFALICRDDLGKEALKEHLKLVKVQNRSGCYNGDTWAHWKKGELTLDHAPCTNVDYVEDRVRGLVKIVETEL